MKLELIGCDERYTAEQSLLALFPEERPVYGSVRPEDERWARITLTEREDVCTVVTELSCDGRSASAAQSGALSGTEYQREGRRRHLIGLSFFAAARSVTGKTPPWGSLTGIRPGKLAARVLESGLTEGEARRRLEEIYFVSPARARLAVEAAQAGLAARRGLASEEIALYVGIPFCPTRCAYCSFVSASVEKSLSLVEPYLAVLTDEIRAAGRMVRELGLRVRTFYMGGGTPTTLTAEQMDRLLDTLEESIDLSACPERTVEAGRPDTIHREKLAVLRRHGITRVSINPQTMEDSVLRAIGRRHTADDIRWAMGQVAEAGFTHVNMDLIAGLPEDTPAGFRRSLAECLTFGADNLTVHTLSLKRGSAILTGGLAIPTADAVAEMLDGAAPALREAGYEPYYLYRQKYMSGSFENVGWCLHGTENLYNIYIMEELCSILSMGAGGSTKMVDLPGHRIRRVFNLKYPKEYTERPEKWASNQAEFAAFYRNAKGDIP
jgi:oxygen-independent coproporphyrinogen-3 oxidase